MTVETADPWTRKWSIVSADLDIAHVMLPLSSFRLVNVSAPGAAPVYKVAYDGEAPSPDCFAQARLVPAGAEPVEFSRITQIRTLPLYTPERAGQYSKVGELIASYVEQNRQAQRLEGAIRIPCHAHGSPIREGRAVHSPLIFETIVHLYQFAAAVEGGLTLLVVRTPLSPVCPFNGDGTAIGYGR